MRITSWGMAFFPPLSVIGGQVDRLADLLEETEEPLRRAVAEVMIPSFEENFSSGGRPPWTPTQEPAASLSESILVRTGELMLGATSMSIWTITPDMAAIQEFPTPYAAFHQEGTSKMPARPFFLMQSEDEDAIAQIFNDWVDDSVRGSGLL